MFLTKLAELSNICPFFLVVVVLSTKKAKLFKITNRVRSSVADKYIYRNCQRHRAQLGLNRTKAAQLSGVSTETLRSIENGGAHKLETIMNVIHAVNEHERSAAFPEVDPDSELERVETNRSKN